MEVYTKNSKELIAQLRQQKKDELNDQGYYEDSQYGATYKQTTNYLIHLVENEFLINDPEVNQLIHSINEKLVSCNPAVKKVRKILVKRDGFLNATSYADGTITLNIGLIANATSEEELAFILAHEIAHYHLQHLRKQIEQYTVRKSSRPVLRRISKIPEGNMTLEDLEFVQSWFNNMFLSSRESELEADSLAILMFKNCGYSSGIIKAALGNLKSVYKPPYPLKRSLFDEFIFDGLPFKKRWLNTKRVLKTDDLIAHLINNDSISTHPEIEIRLEKIQSYSDDFEMKSTPISKSIIDRSRVELIYSFYKTGYYDFGIHTALQLKPQLDSTSEVDFQISRMLYEIALAKNDNRLPIYVRNNTAKYPNETRALNNFFYNLTTAEAAEISYLFTKKNFDSQNPNHYRSLYKIHELTNRMDQNKELKKAFKRFFPKENITKYPDNVD